ncbi:MAG: DUF1476 domain-containing protein [Alphaproteobacteria bacterium]|nr:MAG: DUF1476 domain-containing protein [Alphaproteobacteria bacterium]
MSTFDDREKGQEKKFAHDAEIEFKAQARRDKLLGLWVADLLGKSGPEADAYAKALVVEDLKEPGDEDVFKKVRADLDAGNVDLSDHLLRKKMDELLAEAVAQVKSEV